MNNSLEYPGFPHSGIMIGTSKNVTTQPW